jgi:lipoyl-dependent peroxiredoxin
MKSKSKAVWKGGLKDGQGTIDSQSGSLRDQAYDFRMRFEESGGTNPEELIAAAHAACFSMKLSAVLAEAGMTPEEISTQATVTMNAGTIESVHLETEVRASGGDAEAFAKAAEEAKANCPVSKALTAAISLDARLV